MPGLSGISFARSLTSSPLIIFTTAYPEYAVEGFLTTVNRAMEKLQEVSSTGETSRKILLQADKKLYAVEISNILFVEGQGDYIRITLEDKKLVVHDTIKNFLGSLPDSEFMRTHKSYVVNLKKVTFIEGNQICIGEYTLPVSPNHREELLRRYAKS